MPRVRKQYFDHNIFHRFCEHSDRYLVFFRKILSELRDCHFLWQVAVDL